MNLNRFFKNHWQEIVVALPFILIMLVLAYNGQSKVVECKNCNVILISIDTLRADHLGIDGYERNTSPNIDELFKNGFVFKNAFAQAPNTLPSHMSMLTGLYPSHHKLISITEALDNNESLSKEQKTIAEILKLYGYKTAGFHMDPNFLNPKFGFGRGFDKYEAGDWCFQGENFYNFLNSSKNDRFFLFLHNEGPHEPYVTTTPFDTMFDKNYHGAIIGNAEKFEALLAANNVKDTSVLSEFNKMTDLFWSRVNKSDPQDIRHLIALYDSKISEVDSCFGKLFNYLYSQGFLNNTIIIITADHGEEFNEHGGFLHEKLYDETIHVPLLIYVPNSRPKTITNQVASIDIVPTILSILGLTEPQDIDGRSLKFLMENPNIIDPNQLLYSEFFYQRAVRTPEWKLIKTVNQSVVSYEFFDLKNDPSEKTNLYGNESSIYLGKEKEVKDNLENWEKVMNSTYINVTFSNSTLLGYP